MSAVRVLFVLTRKFGNSTYAALITRAVERWPWIEPGYVFVDESELTSEDAGGSVRWPNWFRDAQVARNKYDRDFCGFVPDCVFINGLELISGFGDLLSSTPSIVAHDSTPALSYSLTARRANSRLVALQSGMRTVFTRPLYRRLFKRVSLFMPWTRWAAASLARDYGVDSARIVHNAPGYDLVRPRLRSRYDGKKVVLFVGNAFGRKGGPFLLSLYEKFIYPHARLRIVSNDDKLRRMTIPPGVEVIHGVTRHDNQLADILRDADLFVLPTRKDTFGLVLLEAAAAGLPVIASDVGAVSELVRDGFNGHLMPYDASDAEWAETILHLLHTDTERLRMGRNSQQLVTEQFSSERFSARLAAALQRLQLQT